MTAVPYERDDADSGATAAAPDLDPRQPVPLPRFDRHVWLCVLIASAVLIPRSWLILRSHSEIIDADYHLRHGLAVLLGNRHLFAMSSTDAPLGQVILALPLAVTGNMPSKPINMANWPPGLSAAAQREPGDPPPTPQRAEFERTTRRGILYGNAWSPQALLQLIAVWKAVLFVPVMIVIFQWSRAIFGLAAAWLTQVMILADPNLAAHIPVVALDSLAVGAIVLACFFTWRYFERESPLRLALAVTFGAAAMLIKHTAVIVPGVFLLFAIYYWAWLPWRAGATWPQWRARLRPRVNTLAAAALIGVVAMWVLLGFDVSVPAEQFHGLTLRPTSTVGQILEESLHRRWPCGTYIGCFVSGLLVNSFGQPALLYGHISNTGWPYYFPVLMTLKMPLGLWLVLLLALASLWRVRLRPGEMSILIPLVAWVAFFTWARMNYGFRHFLPTYVFVLMWAGRCVADAGAGGRWMKYGAWVGVIAAAAHAASFHPDYLSYVNFPRDRVWMQMTDSNIDWGQSMRQVARWLEAHPPPPGRTVHVVTRTTWAGYDGRYHLGDRVHFVERGKPVPRTGILIISPVWVCGVYDIENFKPYEFLQTRTPIDMIGECTLVYDLDENP
ncbi:MAG: hypothetical protein QOF78_899 [Phycisphaerales bacterium]|jgi:hypothetical protein|nr:hypothetical protein [Phycisphaerales bacterium]